MDDAAGRPAAARTPSSARGARLGRPERPERRRRAPTRSAPAARAAPPRDRQRDRLGRRPDPRPVRRARRRPAARARQGRRTPSTASARAPSRGSPGTSGTTRSCPSRWVRLSTPRAISDELPSGATSHSRTATNATGRSAAQLEHRGGVAEQLRSAPPSGSKSQQSDAPSSGRWSPGASAGPPSPHHTPASSPVSCSAAARCARPVERQRARRDVRPTATPARRPSAPAARRSRSRPDRSCM